MTTFILTFAILVLVFGLMAVGVMMGRKPIAGSCGGIAALGIEKECSICGGDRQKCDDYNSTASTDDEGESLAYDATRR